jgi:predicted phage tail protein
MMRDVFLYGAGGRTFGSHFRLDVASPAEAVRALLMLRPGLRQVLRNGSWRIVVGAPHVANSVPGDYLHMSVGEQPIHIVPSTRPAGGGDGKSIGTIIAGTVLIGAAIVMTGGLGAAFATPLIGAMGISYGSVVLLGASMVLGGVASLLTQTPQPQQGQESPTDFARPEDRPSFLFNGVTNNSQQGGPVPLVFGTHLVGSVVVSAGLNAEDIA